MTAVAPFRSVAIAGLGLIGGSLALAIRQRWPAIVVTGVDNDAVIAHVRGSGAIDRAVGHVGELGPVDLLVLCAPVSQNIDMLRHLPPTTGTVTDVGSTKREIAKVGAALGAPAVFVGGHPLGGSERGGFAYASPTLFDGRHWIFTPQEGTAVGVVDALSTFVSGLGARPVTMSPDAHDLTMAYISHLPQLTASALMDVVGTAVGADSLGLAGRGLVDTTRLAASPANVWIDVCQTNEAAIGAALDALIERLTALRRDLGRSERLESLFEAAAARRAALMHGRE